MPPKSFLKLILPHTIRFPVGNYFWLSAIVLIPFITVHTEGCLSAMGIHNLILLRGEVLSPTGIKPTCYFLGKRKAMFHSVPETPHQC